MHNQNEISEIIEAKGKPESIVWLKTKLSQLSETKSAKDLYMTYSLLGSKFNAELCISYPAENETSKYLESHSASLLQIARVCLLSSVLNDDVAFYTPKVANIIQVADTGELETFLKFLILLPNPEAYKQAGVEALRTNIATVFDAISMNNAYPAKYFNDQQWNQMYLKAAFMERDLSNIVAVDERANADLARIISDYAHERWAASRTIDPMFWRPVGKFLNKGLLADMKRLLDSENRYENRAGVLCCLSSENEEALSLLENYKELKNAVAHEEVSWETLKK